MSKAIASAADEPTDGLIARLRGITSEAMRNFIKYIDEASVIVKELEARGVDTRELNIPFILRLREIAKGRLLLDVAIREDLYIGARRFPCSIQRKILDGNKFEVLNIDSDAIDVGDLKHLTFDKMTDIERKMAIDRSPEQQAIWIRNERQKAVLKTVTPGNDWQADKTDKKNPSVVYPELALRISRKTLLQMIEALG